jgi:hypothetical protein
MDNRVNSLMDRKVVGIIFFEIIIIIAVVISQLLDVVWCSVFVVVIVV